MDKEKLSSCIAYSIRRAKHCNQEAAIQYLWQALHSLTLDGGNAPQPKPVEICLFGALELDLPRDYFSRPPPALEVPLVDSAAPVRFEVATQTVEAVITATECELLAKEISQKTMEEALAPVQAMVEQLRAAQASMNVASPTSAIAQQAVDRTCSGQQGLPSPNAAVVNFGAHTLHSPGSSQDKPETSLLPPTNVRAQDKEARRNARKTELLRNLGLQR
eukprot:Skav214321  [mRNA]  locus=scaffold86:61819:62475:+ [translate_table: standard]